MRSDIVPGGTFPDYALPDHIGTVRALSELQGRDPMILTLARGNYCPKEHRQHLELALVAYIHQHTGRWILPADAAAATSTREEGFDEHK